ncbi:MULTISPECIES: hypothetical protein [unclassified Methanoculleus]|jgi:hypothetical protein|uniref:hypothetical protein n=1 Tax=unclassified Methanoculleus TaxID=2619537 RepID=UPI0025F8514F|nr:hypothetical protein [Methanoculleus sp. UBA377]
MVSTPPVVTRIAPHEQAISDDSPDATRVFEIEVDQSAHIIFYHNGGVIYDSNDQTLTSCSVPFSAHRYGVHVITVVAQNSNGRGTLHWTWTIRKPQPSPKPPEITLIWLNTTTVGASCSEHLHPKYLPSETRRVKRLFIGTFPKRKGFKKLEEFRRVTGRRMQRFVRTGS